MNISNNKENFTQGLNSALYAFNHLESSYGEVKLENDILWQVMLENGDKVVWDRLFTLVAESTCDSTEIIIKKIRELLKHEKYSFALVGLNHLLKIPFPETPSEIVKKSVLLILDDMFTMNISDLDEMDRLSIEMLTWSKKTAGSTLGDTIHKYLHDNKVKLNQLIADTNTPDLILAYLSTLLAFDLSLSLKDMMDYLLDREWPFLDSKIQEEQFAYFLWVSFYLSMDAVLLERSHDSSRFIEQVSIPEILLYKVFREVKDTWEDGHQTSKNIVALMNQCSLFENFEKERLWEEVNRLVERQKKGVSAPQSPHNYNFAWPSTEGEESKEPSNRNGNFREETDLHRLGYKITGLNRTERWDILVHKAIPKLTLKEIVYTIAQNVRLRKSQAGGKTKFSYAIGEWEHDLKRLKQDYYKSNFTWPQY